MRCVDLRVATGAPWACLFLILSGMGQSIPMQCERQKICRCVVAVAEVKSSARKILSRSMKMMRVRAAERVAESVECRL